MLSASLRRQVRKRARNRCEYGLSQQRYVWGRLQVDHIWPVAKGGSNDSDNVCLACELCNQYKWTRTEGLDPLTGARLKLFNPRQEQWHEHFSWSEDGTEIIGLTPIGRVTVGVLRLNNPHAVALRKRWVEAGWHPPQF